MKQSQNVHRRKLPLRLVGRYPLTSVLGVWVTLLLLGWLSTAALVNVNNSKAAKVTQVPTVEPSLNSETLATQSSPADDQQPGLPWLSFGAIALTCTLGYVVFSQTLRSTGYQPVLRKISQFKSATPPPSAEIDRQESLALPPRSQPDSSSNAPPLVKAVTVVPKQQNHPLDWDEPSLADSLDMRQRRPLSHWL